MLNVSLKQRMGNFCKLEWDASEKSIKRQETAKLQCSETVIHCKNVCEKQSKNCHKNKEICLK